MPEEQAATQCVVRRSTEPIPGRALPVSTVVVVALVPELGTLGIAGLAYLVHVLGSALRTERLRLRRDLAYGVFLCGFPVAQVLVSAGVGVGNPVLLALLTLLLTAPVAYALCVLVETPSRRLAQRAVRSRPLPTERSSVPGR